MLLILSSSERKRERERCRRDRGNGDIIFQRERKNNFLVLKVPRQCPPILLVKIC
jgi:hypothetical protein